MASMISYFGRIHKDPESNQSPIVKWEHSNSIGSNVSRIECPYTQLRILFEQSLAVAYYLKFYGSRCHEVVNDFIEELNQDISIRFASKYSKTFTDSYKQIYDATMSLVKFNRGGHWVDLDVGLILEYLFDGRNWYDVPTVWKRAEKGNVAAFILFMNKKVSSEYEQYVCDRVGVTTFGLGAIYSEGSDVIESITVRPEHHTVGSTFISTKTVVDGIDKLASVAFLSHFDFSGCSFEGSIGILAQFRFHDDITKFGLSQSHRLGYLLHKGLYRDPFWDLEVDLRGANPTLMTHDISFKNDLFCALLDFVKFCTEHRNMKLVDKSFIARTFGCLAESKQNKDSVLYLLKSGATASADMLKAFQQTMGTCESLVLISQKPTLMTAQTVSQATVSTEATEGGDDNKAEPKQEEQKSESQEADKKDDQTGETQKKEDDDTSPPSSDDDGADDLPSDDTTGEEDAGNPAQPDDNGESGSGSSDPSGTGTSSAQPDTTTEQTNTSDENGIHFEITPPDSSTVDAVIFREEMYKFLSNVLTNPPKCMSPQDIETLNALRKFWLSCLSIDTIKGIVEACIRLPKSIKNSIRKSTEQKQ